MLSNSFKKLIRHILDDLFICMLCKGMCTLERACDVCTFLFQHLVTIARDLKTQMFANSLFSLVFIIIDINL